MKQTIFPKEIVRFTVEQHYFRFSRHRPLIYLLLVGFVLVALILLPVIKVDLTVQSRGVIRSLAEPTVVMTPVTGMVREIRIQENMKKKTTTEGDGLKRLIANSKQN